MHKVRWWKTYHDSYLNDHDVTEEINSYLTTEETMPNVITVSKANLKVNNDIVTTAVQDAIRAIHNNETPIICDGPYKTHLTQVHTQVDGKGLRDLSLTPADTNIYIIYNIELYWDGQIVRE